MTWFSCCCVGLFLCLQLWWQRFMQRLFVQGSPCARPSGLPSPAHSVPGPGDLATAQNVLEWSLVRDWAACTGLCACCCFWREKGKRCINRDSVDSLAGNGDRLGNAVQRRCCSEQRVLINCPLGGSRAHSIIPIFVFLLNKERWGIF